MPDPGWAALGLAPRCKLNQGLPYVPLILLRQQIT